MALMARALAAKGRLAAETVVATVMSNLGLDKSLTRGGIAPGPHRGRRPRGVPRDAGQRLQSGRRAIRPRYLHGLFHHRRRLDHHLDGARAHARFGQAIVRTARDAPFSAGAAQYQGSQPRSVCRNARRCQNHRGRRAAPGRQGQGFRALLRHRDAGPCDDRRRGRKRDRSRRARDRRDHRKAHRSCRPSAEQAPLQPARIQVGTRL